MTLKKKFYKHIWAKNWNIYNPKICLDLYFCVFDLFQENVKELVENSAKNDNN